MSEISPNHPSTYQPRPVVNLSPRPNLRHTGRGYCPKCATTCLLLDDYELYGQDLAYDEDAWEDQ